MEETTLDLEYIWKVILKRKLIIVNIALMFIIFGIIIGYLQNKNQVTPVKEYMYKSTASVLIGNSSNNKDENIKDITVLNQQIVKIYGAIANSRIIAEKTANELKLSNKVDNIIKNVKVSANPETQVISITYGNKEEKDVQRITDTYLKVFISEAPKFYPEAKLKVLDIASKPEKITEEDFDKINKVQTVNQQSQPTLTVKNKTKSSKVILIVSCFLGIMLGFGGAFLMECMDNSVKQKKEAERIMKLPIIGDIQKNDKKIKINTNESYKMIRTALQCRDKSLSKGIDEKIRNNIFMITSPNEGDGKTRIAVNVASSFAEAGYKTLIIDANGRNPKVNIMLNLKSDKGLSNMLSTDTVNLEKCNKDNLYALIWGNLDTNPADAFVKGSINELIEQFRNDFDYVIIDTPSIVDYADAQIISKFVDGVIFAMTENKTDRDKALRARQLVDMFRIKAIGICWIEDM